MYDKFIRSYLVTVESRAVQPVEEGSLSSLIEYSLPMLLKFILIVC